MLRKTVCFILFALSAGIRIFAQDWFDVSTPSLDRKACLVSADYGRVGYRAAVELVNQLSRNRAYDVTQNSVREITAEMVTQVALQLIQKTGKTGTYLMVADVQNGNYTVRWYYIVCAGWDAPVYMYVFAHSL